MQDFNNTSARKLYYVHYHGSTNELKAFHETNWLAIIYCKTFKAKIHARALNEILELNPLFIYCVTSNFTDMEDEVVELLCERLGEPKQDEEGYPLTLGDHTLREAVKFSLESAFHDTKSIDLVVVIDLNEEPLPDPEKQKMFEGH